MDSDSEYRDSREESDEETDDESDDEDMQQGGEEEVFDAEGVENRHNGQRQDEDQIEVEIDLDNLDQRIPEEHHHTQSFGLDGGLMQGGIQNSAQTEMGFESDNIYAQFDWGGGLGPFQTGFDLDTTLDQESWVGFGQGRMQNSGQIGTGLSFEDSLDPSGWGSGLGQDGMQSVEFIFANQAQQLDLWDGNWGTGLDDMGEMDVNE
jgi:hypothetical protein